MARGKSLSPRCLYVAAHSPDEVPLARERGIGSSGRSRWSELMTSPPPSRGQRWLVGLVPVLVALGVGWMLAPTAGPGAVFLLLVLVAASAWLGGTWFGLASGA